MFVGVNGPLSVVSHVNHALKWWIFIVKLWATSYNLLPPKMTNIQNSPLAFLGTLHLNLLLSLLTAAPATGAGIH